MDILVRSDGDQRTFQVKSHMEFRMLISLKVNFINEEVFKDGVLQEGMVKNEMIGFKESEASIKKTASGYDLIINGKRQPCDESTITYTVANIYTQEPRDGQKVYSQYYGKYFIFERLGDHEYKFESPEGDNFYWYENGVCTKVRVERDFATVYFNLKPESLADVRTGKTKF